MNNRGGFYIKFVQKAQQTQLLSQKLAKTPYQKNVGNTLKTQSNKYDKMDSSIKFIKARKEKLLAQCNAQN